MHPRKLVRDAVGLAATQYVVRALLMLRGIVAARLLGPQPYGAWNAIQLMMDYGVFAPLGTQQGLDQDVPHTLVEGDQAGIRRLKQAGLFNIVLLSALFAAACLVWASLGSSRVLGAWGFLGISLALGCIVLTNLAYYHLTLLRSHGNITAVSAWFVFQVAVGAGIGLASIPTFGVWGLLWGWLAGCLVALIFVRVKARHIAPLLPRPSAASIRLLQVGFPMFVFMGSTLVMRSLDRLIVLRWLGTESLGYYSLSVMALTFLLYLPDSISYVLYPQLVTRFAHGGREPEAIREHVERVLKAVAVAMPLLAGLAYLTSRELVLAWLPKFLPGVTCIRVLAFGAVGLALGNLASISLMTLGRQMLLVPTSLFATALGAALDLAAVRMGHGIVGIAWVTLATYVVNGAILLALTYAGIGHAGRAAIVRAAGAFTPLAISIVLAWGFDRFLPWTNAASGAVRLSRMAVAIVGFVGFYAALTRPFGRGMGLRQLVSEFHLPVLGPLFRRLGGGVS